LATDTLLVALAKSPAVSGANSLEEGPASAVTVPVPLTKDANVAAFALIAAPSTATAAINRIEVFMKFTSVAPRPRKYFPITI
jgi:hypothetical protein